MLYDGAVPSIAFLSEGKVFVRAAAGSVQELTSEFAESVRTRAVRIAERHAWKSNGRGARFMMGLGGTAVPDELLEGAAAVSVRVTGLSRGRSGLEVLYSMSTGPVTGLFRADGHEERRLRHGNEVYADPALHPEAELVACSLRGQGALSHVAVMHADGSGLMQLTEGDAIDSAPAWVPGEPSKLVYQSAGLGRDQAGHFAGVGRATVQQLDVRTGQIESLADEEGFELLSPRVGADGTLWCIRRPHGEPPVPIHRMALDVVMLPFRLVWAVFQWLNFFTVRYTGKPLVSAGSASGRRAEMRRMLFLGNLLGAARDAGEDDEGPSWLAGSQLVRRPAGASDFEVVARRVACFDLAQDGSVVWSNGRRIVHRTAEGQEKELWKGRFIEKVVALS